MKEAITKICEYMQKIIMGSNPFDKMCIAKFLTLPRLSPRKLPKTTKSMQYRIETLTELSDLMGWEYSIKGKQTNFKGYREWRREYNGLFESVLFSKGKIEEFDKTEFMTWLDKLPSNARERVKNRIMYHKIKDGNTGEERLRYPEYAIWYDEWLSFKKLNADKQFINGSKTFFKNFERIDNFFMAIKPSGRTELSSIISGIERIMNTGSVDELKEYPVWVLILVLM